MIYKYVLANLAEKYRTVINWQQALCQKTKKKPVDLYKMSRWLLQEMVEDIFIIDIMKNSARILWKHTEEGEKVIGKHVQ